jgi:hypothetical protein
MSFSRTSPIDFEENPISDKDKKQFIAKVRKNNPNSHIGYWENFLEND